MTTRPPELPKVITIEWLRDNYKAFDSDFLFGTFERVFPDGMIVNYENMQKARQGGVRVGWMIGFAGSELDKKFDDEWEVWLADFEKRRRAIEMEYVDKIDALLQEKFKFRQNLYDEIIMEAVKDQAEGA